VVLPYAPQRGVHERPLCRRPANVPSIPVAVDVTLPFPQTSRAFGSSRCQDQPYPRNNPSPQNDCPQYGFFLIWGNTLKSLIAVRPFRRNYCKSYRRAARVCQFQTCIGESIIHDNIRNLSVTHDRSFHSFRTHPARFRQVLLLAILFQQSFTLF